MSLSRRLCSFLLLLFSTASDVLIVSSFFQQLVKEFTSLCYGLSSTLFVGSSTGVVQCCMTSDCIMH